MNGTMCGKCPPSGWRLTVWRCFAANSGSDYRTSHIYMSQTGTRADEQRYLHRARVSEQQKASASRSRTSVMGPLAAELSPACLQLGHDL